MCQRISSSCRSELSLLCHVIHPAIPWIYLRDARVQCTQETDYIGNHVLHSYLGITVMIIRLKGQIFKERWSLPVVEEILDSRQWISRRILSIYINIISFYKKDPTADNFNPKSYFALIGSFYQQIARNRSQEKM